MGRFYLKKVNEHKSFKVDKSDKRFSEWKRIKKRVGFYPQECWNLDDTMILLLYERVCYYKDTAGEVVDLEFNKFNYNNKIYTQRQLIDKIIEYCEKIFDVITSDEKRIRLEDEVWTIWKIISHSMWW